MTRKEFDYEIKKLLSYSIPDSPVGSIFRAVVFVNKEEGSIDWWYVADLIATYMPEQAYFIKSLKDRTL